MMETSDPKLGHRVLRPSIMGGLNLIFFAVSLFGAIDGGSEAFVITCGIAASVFFVGATVAFSASDIIEQLTWVEKRMLESHKETKTP